MCFEAMHCTLHSLHAIYWMVAFILLITDVSAHYNFVLFHTIVGMVRCIESEYSMVYLYTHNTG